MNSKLNNKKKRNSHSLIHVCDKDTFKKIRNEKQKSNHLKYEVALFVGNAFSMSLCTQIGFHLGVSFDMIAFLIKIYNQIQ